MVGEGLFKGELDDHCPITWRDSKWRPVFLERDGFWTPNLTETYPCGAKNENEIYYRILDYRQMGVKVQNVTMT